MALSRTTSIPRACPSRTFLSIMMDYSVEKPPCNVFTQHFEGTAPLYRMYNDPVTDHFYTTNAADKDRAITATGNCLYHFEAIAGYVWPDASFDGG